MALLRTAFVFSLIIGGMGLAWQYFPARSKLLLTRTEPHFPIVSGNNLDRQELEFPRDFAGEYNLVIVAFQQHHQLKVNTWIPYVQEIEASFPGFVYYELPTISAMPTLSRTFINEGMRAGIPDQTARERTVTLYLNKQSFKTALAIPNENDIYLFLVDREGSLLWNSSGDYTPDKAAGLLQVLQELRK